MKKFILINSPIYFDEKSETEQYLSPLGLAYIATELGKNNVDVDILDGVKEHKTPDEIVDSINNECPDFVGINIFTPNYEIVKSIVERIDADCECFIGGPVVKSIYNDLLKWNVKNKFYIIIGEGELIIPAIVNHKCLQSPEIIRENKYVYRVNDNSKYFPEDISKLFIDRKYLKNEILINHYKEEEASIITSRGCPYNCAFCGGARSLNNDCKIRIRDNNSIITEIQNIVDLYPDVKSIRILDDLFIRDSKSIDNAYSIFNHFSQLSWRGMAHVRSLKNNLGKLDKLKSSKCKELFVGIESGSEAVRKKINKLGKVKDIIDVSTAILQNGIDLKGYFIYGFPEETKSDFQKTYELASKITEVSHSTLGNFRTSVFQFRPYEGTELYREIFNGKEFNHDFKINNAISGREGRTQFNLNNGNYSKESDEMLEDFINKTLDLK